MFVDHRDYRAFIDLAAQEMPSAGVAVWAYALMRNHVHFIAVPDDVDSIPDAAARCLAAYEEAFRRRHGDDGRLWEDRLYVSVLDRQEFLWRAVCYVERNPVRAGIVLRGEDYPWSSAAYHCGERAHDPLIAPDSPLPGAIHDWSGWLRDFRWVRRRETPASGSFSTKPNLRIEACGPVRGAPGGDGRCGNQGSPDGDVDERFRSRYTEEL